MLTWPRMQPNLLPLPSLDRAATKVNPGGKRHSFTSQTYPAPHVSLAVHSTCDDGNFRVLVARFYSMVYVIGAVYGGTNYAFSTIDR